MNYCTDCERYAILGPTGQCHQCWQEDQEQRESQDMFSVECEGCGNGYEQTGKEPAICGACGSDEIEVENLTLAARDRTADRATRRAESGYAQ